MEYFLSFVVHINISVCTKEYFLYTAVKSKYPLRSRVFRLIFFQTGLETLRYHLDAQIHYGLDFPRKLANISISLPLHWRQVTLHSTGKRWTMVFERLFNFYPKVFNFYPKVLRSKFEIAKFCSICPPTLDLPIQPNYFRL